MFQARRRGLSARRRLKNPLREASLALGVPRWKTILAIVVPTAKSGVITGVVLSMARAGGETAPLLLTALGNQFFNYNLLQPTASLPVQIYNYAVAPTTTGTPRPGARHSS